MNKIISKIGLWHSKIFSKVSEKARTSKIWAIVLSLLVVYELIEHIVYPILVPYLLYLNFWSK
jgi:hypothetical protein